ncbi:MAG: urate hydroxylase PuuD [Aquabacterium sp.]
MTEFSPLLAYALDWANLLLRWAHVIVAIAWVGSSFYFVWLDNSLTPPTDEALKSKGVGGELWAVHGGGFYNPQKYLGAPKALPAHLHWFYWESYSTWLTGFALFTALYLFNAGTFLVDKAVYAWTPPEAIGAALGFLAGFWVLYDLACRTLGQRHNGDKVVGAVVLVLVVGAAWLACQLFAGRAAFLLVGAMMATSMSANVFFWIIPGQRKVVAAMKAGEPVDPVHGKRGKQRSVHNTYFTLPVLFAMLSNPLRLGLQPCAQLAGARADHAGRRLDQAVSSRPAIERKWPGRARHGIGPGRHRRAGRRGRVAGAGACVRADSQAQAEAEAPVTLAQVHAIAQQRCVVCHNAQLANKGVMLYTPELIQSHAQQIYQQAVVLKLMPMNNATGITDDERAQIKRWYEAQVGKP